MIGRQFAHFRITGKLGEGGMGEVYRAEDLELGREVAIKVLPEAFTADPERVARFAREAKVLASLNHPNIAQIYGLETSGSTRALVMELVEGPTLAERLEGGALPLEEALSIASGIAEALEEAHEQGIVHRDLKPQNVKISVAGRVKVLDFGLAKATDPLGSGAVPTEDLSHSPTATFDATRAGVILGTAAYMAPEQARGGAVDKRADIWAFGVVLYEMLIGERLFAEGSLVDTLSAVMRKEIDLARLPETMPPRLRELLGRCLERDPKRRLRDIGEARLVLAEGVASEATAGPGSGATTAPSPVRGAGVGVRVGAAVAVAALVVMVAVLLLRGREITDSPAPEAVAAAEAIADRSIAVLPFQNLSAESENEFFAAGVHEDVLTYLSRVADLKVISRSSVMQYAEPGRNLKEVAADLGVTYVVEGSVRRAASRVRVTAQLIDARTDEHLWADNFDRELEDVFAIQTAIAEEIVRELEASLTPREAELLASPPTTSVEAYDLYLQARQRIQQQRGLEYDDEAVRLLEQAIRLDPQFARAYALLAHQHGHYYWFLADRTPDRLARMKSVIDRAFELDPDLPEARLALAEYYYRGFYDYPRALEQLELAQGSMPNDALLFHSLGLTYRRVGEYDRSLDSFERASRLDPANVQPYFEALNTAAGTGRVERGLAIAEVASRRFPTDPVISGARAYLRLVSFGDVVHARSLLDAVDDGSGWAYYHASYWTSLFEREFRQAAETAKGPSMFDAIANGWGATRAAEALTLGGFEAEADQLLMEAAAILAAEVAEPYAETYAWPHLAYAENLSLQGRHREALASCARATSILPFEKDKVHGAQFRGWCARVKARSGKIDEALEEIEWLLEHGWKITHWQLALDPRWDFLRENERFRELATVP